MPMVRHGTTVVDADARAIIREPAPRAPKRRGRPKGTRGKVLIAETGVQQSDLVFLRAVAEGVTPKDAAERYFGHRGSMDKRTATAYAEQLQVALRMTIDQLADAGQREQARAALDAVLLPGPPPVALQELPPVELQENLALPSPETAIMPVVSLPTLEEFAQRFDDDMYSEGELIEEFKSVFGVEPGLGPVQAAAPEPLATEEPPKPNEKLPLGNALSGSRVDRLTALRWLEDHLSRKPLGTDPCSNWLETSIAVALVAQDVGTLSELVVWINARGARWYSQIPGCGKTRARRLMWWLLDSEDEIGTRLIERLRPPLPSDQATSRTPAALGRELALVQGGIATLEMLDWPPELEGRHGEFRGGPSNTLRVDTDRQALMDWLESIKDKSPATVESYRRGVSRLVFWALLERRRALSDLDQTDFREFVEFLRNPPAHWVTSTRVMQISRDWRPLRGPQGDESIRLTMAAVSRFYQYLLKAGYLSQNAVPLGTARRKEVTMDVMRSFASQQLDAVRETLEAMKDTPRRRRLRAIILLLQTAGLRRNEAANATWGHVTETRIDNAISDGHHLDFLGKGNKQRRVPLHEVTLAALRDHFEDRSQLVKAGKLPYARLSQEETPLLSILDDRLTRTKAGQGFLPHDAARSGNPNGALSPGRLHGLLKEFFSEVSTRAHEKVPGSSKAYLKASAHWFRHTFAHQVLAATKGDLAVAQQLLGHASLSTTGIYVKADLAKRAEAVSNIKPAV
ncbi:phage integrase family protein [Hydrogenophaga sp. 2FB]|uniref:phage integrase family protein n=1 Tax=Hydrogenophaga sp. 2FB TaxID=2502187 RepID=UPI0014856CE6|nr:phage integrase family protein [Hydrogenophaga sp. 2FB]